MRLEDEEYSIEQAEVKGRELPQWYLEEPPLYVGDDFYIKAFWRLSTCRPQGLTPGKIPWFALVEYGHHVGLDDDTIELFELVISAMDNAYTKRLSEKAEKDKQTQGGKGKKH